MYRDLSPLTAAASQYSESTLQSCHLRINSRSELRKYSTDYYYNRLNSAQQKLWDDFESACYNLYYSDTSLDLSTSCFATFNLPDYGITIDEALQTQNLFFCSHPEYFFFGNGYTSNSDNTVFGILCHKKMRSYNERAAAIEYIEELTDIWMSEIDAIETDSEKERYIARLVADNIIYNHTDSSGMNQSMGGGLYYGTCVCMGYALAFEYLCNGAGLECVIVGGNGHAWNRVKLDGLWYEADPTWYDEKNMYSECWLKKSTKSFLAITEDASHNVSESFLSPVSLELPQCVTEANEFPDTMTVYPGDRGLRVEWPCISGADYYKVSLQKGTEGYKTYAKFWGPDLTFFDLENGAEYSVYVTGYNSSGNIIGETPVMKVTPKERPYVTGLKAVPGVSSAVLSWDKVSGAKKYYIYRVINGEYVRAYSTVETSLKIGGLDGGTAYTYAVRPCFDNLIEAYTYSESVSVTPSSPVYKVSVSVNAAVGGKASVSVSSGGEGTELTATAVPNDGYIFAGWKATGTGAEISDPNKPTISVTIGCSDVKLTAAFYKRIETKVTTTSSSAIVNFEGIDGASYYRVCNIRDEEAYYRNACGGFFTKTSAGKAVFGNMPEGETKYFVVYGFNKNDELIAKSDLFIRIIRDMIPAEASLTENGCILVNWKNVSCASTYKVIFYASPEDYEKDKIKSGTAEKTQGPSCIGISKLNIYYLAVVGYDTDGNMSTKSELLTVYNPDAAISITSDVSPVSGGTVTLSSNTAISGETITVRAAANEGYVFSKWSISGEGAHMADEISSEAELTVGTKDVTVTAVFLPIQKIKSPEGVNCSLSVSAKGEYEWQIKSGSQWVYAGSRDNIINVSADGEYRCIVTDADSKKSVGAYAKVEIVPADEVTAAMLEALDDADIIDFVNYFTDKDEQCIILTDAQLYAIERVLRADLGT